ncbi:MAG: hypothetical protein ACREVE_17485, partial [Gammaproteobacteria bacterium]
LRPATPDLHATALDPGTSILAASRIAALNRSLIMQVSVIVTPITEKLTFSVSSHGFEAQVVLRDQLLAGKNVVKPSIKPEQKPSVTLEAPRNLRIIYDSDA